MGSRGTEFDDQPTADNTPEDVAVLYSWANLQGAKYRDYSASRREYRAQVRYRAAKALLERELKAQAEAEAAEGGTERVDAARRAETAAHAAVLALREEREIAEAHASARRQALIYAESENRRRQLAGPQPHNARGDSEPLPTIDSPSETPGSNFSGYSVAIKQQLQESREQQRVGGRTQSSETELETTGPAWLYASQTPPQAPVSQVTSQVYAKELPGGPTLQDSRERVAARWFALKGVFENAGPELPAMQPIRTGETRVPLLAIFSLAGGVGKTSLAATLARSLSTQGEKVLLTDTTSHGLLPFYFGARSIRPGVVHTFPMTTENATPPISLAIYDAAGKDGDERRQQILAEEILRHAPGNHRLMLDLTPSAGWLVRSMADLHPTVLVPMAPDMNSVISLQAVERLFRGITDSDGRPVLPFYVLNQFDATLPLHLDVREVLRRQLGDRLLPVAIRRSPAVSEALAEGMTVVDYVPSAPVSQDYRDVAMWLRSVSPPTALELSSVRWGEQ